MDFTNLRAIMSQLQDEVNRLDPPVDTSIRVTAGQSIQSAIDSVAPGTSIFIEPATYNEVLTIKKSVYLRPLNDRPLQRASANLPSGVVITSSGQTVTNLSTTATIRDITLRSSNPDSTIVTDNGVGFQLLMCLVLGDDINGQHRGIAANGESSVFSKCVVDQIKAVGREAQALSGWDGSKNILLDDCIFYGATQSVMFGGADPQNMTRSPQNIVMNNCLLSKRFAWYAEGVKIKNAFELKNCNGFTMDNCTLEYAGLHDGQGAYGIVLTPRNQGGTAPYSTVRSVILRNSIVRFCGGGVSMMAKDDRVAFPSDWLDDVHIENMLFDEIDPKGITVNGVLTPYLSGKVSPGHVFQFANGPKNITIQDVTIRGRGIKAEGYFYGPPPTGLKLSNIVCPPTTYGWKIDGGGQTLDTLKAYAPDVVLNLLPTDTGAKIV